MKSRFRTLLVTLGLIAGTSGYLPTATLHSAAGQTAEQSAPTFVAVRPDADFQLPKIVIQHDPARGTGYDWETLDKLPFHQSLTAQPAVLFGVRYLRDAVKRMTGRELEIVSSNDLSRGIVLTTLKNAPAELQKDREVLQALRDNGKDSYNANEAFFIRSEPQRLLIVTNTEQGFPVAIVELLESVDYEVLGMGPDWIHVPDYKNKPLTFSLKKSGRAGFYIRALGGASGAPYGIGTLFQKPLSHPADETVEVSYYQNWTVGTRMASRSMPDFPGHALWQYHPSVIEKIKETKNTIGFLNPVSIGPDANRPEATEVTDYHLWINDDPDGQPGAGKIYSSYNKKWAEAQLYHVPGALDLSVPYVREIILQDMKQRAQAHFEKSPDELFVFGTDPEDGTGYANVGERLHNKNWYPEYLKQEGVKFSQPYVLHGFKGLNQPVELWDHTAASDTVFGFNNWLLREYDQWIDSLPAEQRVTKTGKPKKEMVRASLYSYNQHDVPPNFNLDPRIRAMIAGYPAHRGRGKWKNYASSVDMAQAFQKQLPREPSGDYWILSLAMYYDHTTAAIANYSKRPATLHHQIQELYGAGFRAVSGEIDFNFGRLGLDYYLYPKLLWNPQMSTQELNALRDRWLQRSFGSGWQTMKEYYDYMAPENNVINAPNKWGKAIRMIDAADAEIDNAKEPAAQRRLDDLKQFWYFYYLLESGQNKSDSPAMKEFLWKGQMSYMTAMHAVAGNIFKTEDARAAVGPELSAGPAHYTHEETQQWWSKVLDFWKVTPVTEFSDVVLANGRTGKEVDLNDLVGVAEFQSEKPDDKYFYYDSQAYKATVYTVASQPGEEIGFKLTWNYDPAQTRFSAKDVPYGIARWNLTSKRWDELLDISTHKQPSITVEDKNKTQLQIVEVRFEAPMPGTYRIDIGHGGAVAKLASLGYDEATDSFNATHPFVFSALAEGYTQSPAYFYIPKGLKNLDLEIWGEMKSKRILNLYRGLPGKGMQPSRQIEVTRQGTHHIELEPGEDGSIASFSGDWFYMPQLYSAPQVWAKSPEALLVPRAVAEADGLTIRQ